MKIVAATNEPGITGTRQLIVIAKIDGRWRLREVLCNLTGKIAKDLAQQYARTYGLPIDYTLHGIQEDAERVCKIRGVKGI
jgi:hypothetical protein